MNRHCRSIAAVAMLSLSLGGCIAGSTDDPMAKPAMLVPDTKTGIVLDTLPPPRRSLDVTVYNFPDLTGQNKEKRQFRGVLAGSHARWQRDPDRRADQGGRRQLVQCRRAQRPAAAPTGTPDHSKHPHRRRGDKAPSLPPLRFAGILLEGGIIGFDSDETTGGVGANYLGVGPNVQYRQDIITVALRAVSVQTGRIVASVTTTKTIYSLQVQGTAFLFAAVDQILQADLGFTKNSPATLGVREGVPARRLFSDFRRREEPPVGIQGQGCRRGVHA